MKLTISHEFDVDVETFWSRLFLDPEFNQALYVGALGFPEYKVLEEQDRGGEVVRKVRVVPRHDAPAAIQKLFGERFAYTEEGTFDKTQRRYRFRVVPGAMADKVKTDGELWVEALGPKKVRRVVDTQIEAKVFGIGGMIESFAVKSTRESYDQAAVFTRKWIADKGL
jgi:hypothetical protein